jgi:hypothetical protein
MLRLAFAFWLTVWVALAVLLGGCSAMPTMKYCETVSYERHGSKITIMAECHAPVGESISGL